MRNHAITLSCKHAELHRQFFTQAHRQLDGQIVLYILYIHQWQRNIQRK